ncbi:MAG: thiamine diphosphokinase [Pseudomonadota bacterium]
MTRLPLRFDGPVTLVGGGALDRSMLEEARELAPDLVAADGGANLLADWGLPVAALIGDMDSVEAPNRVAGAEIVALAEQDSTDFEKCLYATKAPFYLAAGFTGGRVDHMLAVFNAMLRRPEPPVVLIGEEEVIALAPPGRTLVLELWPGARVSFFPLGPAKGIASEGLAWSVEGLAMAPDGRIGTSNRAEEAAVMVGFDRPGILVMLERAALSTLIHAVTRV